MANYAPEWENRPRPFHISNLPSPYYLTRDFGNPRPCSDPSSDWVSNFPQSVWESARTLAAPHPNLRLIKQTFIDSIPEGQIPTLSNAPTGCAVDIAAYLSGEPDNMLTFSPGPGPEPIRALVSLGAAAGCEPSQITTRLGNVLSALYSISSHRPVSLTPIVYFNSASATRHTWIALFPELSCSDSLDLNLLSLYSDPRILRQFALDHLHEVSNSKARESFPLVQFPPNVCPLPGYTHFIPRLTEKNRTSPQLGETYKETLEFFLSPPQPIFNPEG